MRTSQARLALLLLASLAACDPQVVDAVESSAGASGTDVGGGSGSGGTGGSGEAGGTGGTETAGSGGTGGTDMAGTGGTGGAGGTPCDPLVEPDPDGDGSPNCADQCPLQSWKQTPGACGCEIPDEDIEGMMAGCLPLRSALIHRYSFAGTSTTVIDTASGADATIFGGVTPANGAVTLGGRSSGDYVDLPNGLVSSLTSVTFEAWVTWAGGAEWQRIFDFGDDESMLEGGRGTGRTYLFLTTQLPDDPFARVAFQGPDARREFMLNATRALRSGMSEHVAVTWDDEAQEMSLYFNGELDARKVRATTDIPVTLAALNDVNSWLGRSQYELDADFGGAIDEFRIYSIALSALQVRTSFDAGPNPAFLPDPL